MTSGSALLSEKEGVQNLKRVYQVNVLICYVLDMLLMVNITASDCTTAEYGVVAPTVWSSEGQHTNQQHCHVGATAKHLKNLSNDVVP